MKKIIILMTLIIGSAHAAGFVCKDIPFSDIESIEVNIHHGDVFVKEFFRNGESKLSITSQNINDEFQVNISDWVSDYSRVLFLENGRVGIELTDECSYSVSYLTCNEI